MMVDADVAAFVVVAVTAITLVIQVVQFVCEHVARLIRRWRPPPEDVRLPTDADFEAFSAPFRRRRQGEDGQAREREWSTDECAVCLGAPSLAVEYLPCGHVFCGACTVQLWQHNNGAISTRRLRCPLDREEVQVIVPHYALRAAELQAAATTSTTTTNPSAGDSTEGGERARLEAQQRDIDRVLHQYNTGRSLSSMYSFAGLVAAVRWCLSVTRFLPWLIRVRVIVTFASAALYTLSPIDLLPEAIFGLVGFVDDLLVLIICALVVGHTVQNILAAQQR